jgi:N-ethylmaleimide reductase
MGAPPVPETIKATIRELFKGSYIAAGGFTLATAEKVLDAKQADLVAFGRPFLSNPDLVARLANDWPLAAPDMGTAYTPGPKGYIDYPVHGA